MDIISLTWIDCIDGTTNTIRKTQVDDANHIWEKPATFGGEVALYIYREDSRPAIKRVSVTKRRADGPDKLFNVVPVAKGFKIETAMNTTQNVQLQYTDADGGPGPYAIHVLTNPKHGTLSGLGNDKIYTPNHAYQGVDQFMWEVNDGEGDSGIATVTIHVKGPKGQ